MSIIGFFKKIFGNVVAGNCLGVLIAGIALTVGTIFFLDFYTHHGETITIPDVSGLDEQVAKKKLKALGLKIEVSDTGYVVRAAPFTVLKQSIKPGEIVKYGRTVYLTINANGPRLVAIPDIADNCSRREAEDKLRALGFKLGMTEYIMGEPEWVIGVKANGKNVTAGTKVSINMPITLVVGAGGLEEEYNGNDSLDYILNTPEEEDIIEGEVVDAPSDNFPDNASSNPSTDSFE